METFGKFLEAKRKENKMTMRELAKKLGYTPPHISDVEKGRRGPFDITKLNLLVEILDLNKQEAAKMMELAGEYKDEIAPDLPEYIKKREYVSYALRTAKELNADKDDWESFVQELKEREKK